LSDAQYAALDELEKVRHDLHVDVDAIMDAIPYAELDARSVGFRRGRGYDAQPGRASSVRCDVCNGTGGTGLDCAECRGTGAVPTTSEYSDPTSALAFGKENRTASEWLTQATDVSNGVTRTANRARYHFGFDPEHGKPERSRPNQKPDRRPEVEVCGFCGEPAPSGRDGEGKSLLRRVDEIPVHASPCYWTLAKQALRAGVTPGAQLKGVVAARSTAKGVQRVQPEKPQVA